MKKNKWTRMASVLLVLCLITTCAVSGTYAKYVAADSATDNARVAKWGINIVAGGSLFSNAYFDAASDAAYANGPAIWNASEIGSLKFTVATDAEDGDNLVAPGTHSIGDGLVIGLGGIPEVAAQIEMTLAVKDVFLNKGTYAYLTPITLNAYTFETAIAEAAASITASTEKHMIYVKDASNGFIPVASGDPFDASLDYFLATVYEVANDYYPVKYTSTSLGGAATFDTVVQMGKAFRDEWSAITGVTVNVDPDTDYSMTIKATGKLPANYDYAKFNLCSAVDGTPMTLKWDWAFSGNDCGDTVLGHLMAMKAGELPTNDILVLDNVAITAGTEDGTFTDGTDVIANLFTSFDIEISVVQID